MIKKLIIIILLIVLIGCTPDKEIDQITQFSTNNDGDYLLFHFIDPFETEGYILEINNSGQVAKKHKIKDKLFAPSDVFYYEQNYYFASGAYSGDTKVVEYQPTKRKLSLINTNQKKYIEKYYKDNVSDYIVTVMDKNDDNEFCDLQLNKCVKLFGEFRVHTVSTLENYIMVVAVDKSGEREVVKIKKYDRDLKFLNEITLNKVPNYFTYTSLDNKRLYLFMYDGDIVEIDSSLNHKIHELNLSEISSDILRVKYNKNVVLNSKSILVDMEIETITDKIHLLNKISFGKNVPKLEIIQSTVNEDILNIDYDANEVYTRSYVNNKTVLTIRDTRLLGIKNKITLDNSDQIYFIDNIND
ncbi:hypothetical protein [Pseudalkalibacillus sp. SCS-8]|uniref:hypothetical protein n=1 Tax=Pseudalkalibacillus nanhaiensis TaxID=3115291 RepID=UPI0032DA54E8